MNSDLNSNQTSFSSSELALCAALICLEFPLDSLDKSTPQRTIFQFKRSEELDLAVANFWQRKLLLEPLAFFEAQRYLKSRIYGE